MTSKRTKKTKTKTEVETETSNRGEDKVDLKPFPGGNRTGTEGPAGSRGRDPTGWEQGTLGFIITDEEGNQRVNEYEGCTAISVTWLRRKEGIEEVQSLLDLEMVTHIVQSYDELEEYIQQKLQTDELYDILGTVEERYTQPKNQPINQPSQLIKQSQ